MVLIALLSCAADRPMPLNDAGGAFWDQPWPSDLRRTESGGLDMTGFPQRELDLVGEYLDLMERQLDGFGTNSPIYFRFNGALDTELLPSPRGSVYPAAAVFLIDVDPESPDFAQPIPIQWDWQATDTTFQDPNTLTIAPIPGVPLRPSTTYAAVITTELAQAEPGFAELWDPDHPDHALVVDLEAALFERGVGVEQVAIATVFTTQDPIQEMAELAQATRALDVQLLDQSVQEIHTGLFFDRYEGDVWVPLWQHGERPYTSQGGGFVFQDGEPVIGRWERVRFTLTVPQTEDMPADGWPVVIYQHGTGGDHTSCCSEDGGMGQASRAAQAGLAVIGIAQPLHGDRAEGADPSLHTFNYFNPDSARSNFRQGGLDAVYLAHILSGAQHTFTLPDGTDVVTDPDQTLFLGHSQGGISGAIALPFMSDLIQGAALSGAGGGLALSMVYRKQGGLDIQELVTSAVGFSAGEELDPLHPVAGLVQTFAEATDSLNYSPYWSQRRSWFSTRAVPILMFEGMLDEHTPPITTEAMAAAGGIPVLEPVANLSDAARILAVDPVVAPVSDNIDGWGDHVITAGLAQYPDQDHFAIHNEDAAADLYRDFLRSLVDGAPAIQAPY